MNWPELLDGTIRAVLVAFLTAAVAAPIVYRLLLKTGSRQTVSEFVPEHSGKQGTPTMGGLIIVAGLVAMLVTTRPIPVFALALVLWFALIGFLDDFLVPRLMPGKRGLGWMPKLGLETLPFLALWLVAPATPIWVLGVTAFVVLFFSNAYNFADGLDGLAGGLGLVLALTLGLIGFLPGGASVDRSMAPVMIALACAVVPFLVLNAPPAKVFMGDVGSLPIGALLGLGFLQVTLFREPAAPDWRYVWCALPMLLVMLVEIVPGPLQIASAKLRKGKRLFPFKTPVHHGFQSAGWPETRVVALFVLTQFVGSMATLALTAMVATGRWR